MEEHTEIVSTTINLPTGVATQPSMSCGAVNARLAFLHGVVDRNRDLRRCAGAGSTQPSSFPRFAAIKTLQREQDLTSLAPKGRLIAAQPI
jgi:hypothetical protein